MIKLNKFPENQKRILWNTNERKNNRKLQNSKRKVVMKEFGNLEDEIYKV